MQEPSGGKAVARKNSQLVDDLRLVGELLTGSDRAWREFVTRYAGLVRSRVARVAAACGLGMDGGLIDDLVAEVFSALLNNDSAALRAFAGRSSLATYLCVIATRIAIRKSVRNVPSACEAATGEVVDVRTETPAQLVISAEQHAGLHRAIDALPDKQQAMVRLFYLEGLTYEQISRQLDIPVGSVGPTLKRAEAKLRSQIK